ncbi:spore coat protein CotJB [Paenibacillus sp. FA6]|uniref:spore coat protein CotJB n=1 Tax=Paenibacillus sp. FA6 TaxID=3413029 RepID=UPI003F65AE6F
MEGTPIPCDQQYYEWLEELQIVDFALVELNLFLDTHPEDLQSIQQYNQLSQERMRLAKQFQEVYGPLLNFGHAFSKFPWQWSQSPWPWQV